MRQRRPRPPARFRWLGAALSVLILGAFVVFYVVSNRKTVERSVARDLRLLGVASDALRQSLAQSARANAWLDRAGCDGVWVEIDTPKLDAAPREPLPASGATKHNAFCLDYDDILGFVPRAERAFDKTLLVGRSDRVLRQAGRPEVPTVTTLSALKLVVDGKPTDKAVHLAETGPIAAVHFGDGEPYRLFCQSSSEVNEASAADAEKDEPTSLYLCGLASEKRIHGRWLLSPGFLSVLGLVLVLTLLLPPFLRLKLLSPTERFRFVDAFALGVCVLFSLILVTLATRGVVTHLRLESFVDTRLETLATHMAENVRDELQAAKRQLEAASSAREDEPGVRAPRSGEWRDYGYAETIAWADSAGEMRSKVTVLPLENQSLLSLAERPYFQRARASDELVIDSVRSYSSGKSRAVIARRAPGLEGALGVRLVTFVPRSLTRPALPEGTSFAVVSDSGDVLFHSEPALANSHNVLTECDDNGQLRRLLEREHGAEASGSVDRLSYFGVDHRAYVKPIDTGPASSRLSLVVFTETAALRAVVLETLTWALFSSIAYAAFWLAVGVLYLVLAGRRRLAWFWPEARRHSAYVGLFFWFLALIATAVQLLPGVLDHAARQEAELAPPSAWSLTAWSLASTTQAFAFCLPLLVVLSAWLVFSLGKVAAERWSRGTSRRPPRSTKGYWRAYCMTGAAFWVLCAVIPPYVFGSVSMDDAARRFADHQAASFALRANAPSETPSSTTDGAAPIGPSSYRAPGPRAYETTLQLGPSGAPALAKRLLEALHAPEPPRGARSQDARAWLAWLLSVVFAVGVAPLVFWLVRWLSETVLLRDVEAPPALTRSALAAQAGNLWCVVASPRTLEGLPRPGAVTEGAAGPLLVGECFSTEPKLADLERLHAPVGAGALNVIAANRSPLELLRALQSDKEAAPEDIARLARRLRDYRVVYLQQDPTDVASRAALVRELLGTEPPPSPKAHDWLTRELDSSAFVYDACRANLAPGSLADAPRSEAQRRVRDAAWHDYLEVWSSCSPLEQLTLVQLAEEGFVSEQRAEVVRALLGRGILARRPMLAPFNDSFAAFVRVQGAEASVRAWEAPPEGLAFQHLRAPLFVLFACSAYVLFFTERSLFDSTLLFATTLTALLPQLGRLVAHAVPSLGRIAAAPEQAESTAA